MIGNSNLLAEQVISTFSFNNNSIRCILINGDPWFCLKEDLTLGDNNDCNFYCGMVNQFVFDCCFFSQGTNGRKFFFQR